MDIQAADYTRLLGRNNAESGPSLLSNPWGGCGDGCGEVKVGIRSPRYGLWLRMFGSESPYSDRLTEFRSIFWLTVGTETRLCVTLLARIIHERFCYNRGFAAATSLRRAGSPLATSTYCFKYASVSRRAAQKTPPPHRLGGVHKRGAHYSSRRGPRNATARFRYEPHE